ncbi:hypothetical protein [Arthrobacter roseus]|uniref:hypothetical protein n=1 Tax=Arthrobacter roseus TaxID=136274 RepID=UPI0019629B43|nr:hypothetical protein [Arthrobacter roseus]MBM7848436.1 hypothetical protein [Arthrobacter roseus]
MGLNLTMSRLATSRVHVLILEIPGLPIVRMHVEAAITARGWVLAESPADADVLLVVGEATGTFAAIADRVWNQIPGPRHRTSVTAADAISGILDMIPAVLGDQQSQILDARGRPQHVTEEATELNHDVGGEPSGDGSAGMDMEMDDMDMDMSGPAGIPLASGDDSDRDGLEMDIIHLTLGPVLPNWPAGLVVHCTLHGDVIGGAAIEFLPGIETVGPPAGPQTASAVRAAVLCDAAGHLLAIAGWEPAAAKIHRIRDGLLTGTGHEQLAERLHRVTRQLTRSRTLRWSLAGIPKTGEVDARELLLGWLQTAAALLVDEQVRPDGSSWPETIDDIRSALIGQELSVARLLVACIEPSRISELSRAVHG